MNPDKTCSLQVLKFDDTEYGLPIQFSKSEFPTRDKVFDMVEKETGRTIARHLFLVKNRLALSDLEYLESDESRFFVLLKTTIEEWAQRNKELLEKTEKNKRESEELSQKSEELSQKSEEHRREREELRREREEIMKKNADQLGITFDEYNSITDGKKTVMEAMKDLQEKVVLII